MSQEEFVPIKKIAGDVLLLLYYLQRQQGYCDEGILSFDRNVGSSDTRNQSEFWKKILAASRQSATNAYNALRYLQEKGFISFKESRDTGGYHFINISVTGFGVDIIEGIERGPEERREFHVTFNIKLADNVNIDSLIKGEIENVIKLSAL